MKLTPYINFNGQCEEALNFYAKVLGGEVKHLSRFEGSPAEDMSADKQKILHATFEAGEVAFMASDSGESESASSNGGMVHLTLSDFQSAKELDKVFAALSEGGKITMPLQDAFWGARFGMLIDKFGVNWMFNHELQKN
ncbi:MAG: VOC family protein [Bacteroidota bacterium]|nr:VOC family protein [Bacteroidota bacterium]